VLPILDFCAQLVMSSSLTQNEFNSLLQVLVESNKSRSAYDGRDGTLLAVADPAGMSLPGVAAGGENISSITSIERERVVSSGADKSPAGKYETRSQDNHMDTQQRLLGSVGPVLIIDDSVRSRARKLIGSHICVRVCLLAGSEQDAVAIRWLRKLALIAEALRGARQLLARSGGLAEQERQWGECSVPRVQVWVNYKKAPAELGGSSAGAGAVLCGLRPEQWSEGRFNEDTLGMFLLAPRLLRGEVCKSGLGKETKIQIIPWPVGTSGLNP